MSRDAASYDAADQVVDSGVGRAYPGAVLAVGRRRGPTHLRAFGRLAPEQDAPAVVPDTIYDLASLTKVVVTTTLAMMLVDEGRLSLDAELSAVLPEFRGAGREAVRLHHLLSHSAGVRWWAPLYETPASRDAILARVAAMPLEYPPGSASRYSDLGFLLLGGAIERLTGAPLGPLAAERVLGPLGMSATGFCPTPAFLPRIAPTEDDPWRGRRLRGEVHDENAFALGGVAPHAGLFGTAADLARFARFMLDEGLGEERELVSAETVRLFTRRAGVPGSSRALGWDTASDGSGRRSSEPGTPGYSSAGSLLSDAAYGHTGFTGTSLWIDPDRGLYVILLANRVCPSRRNDAIRGVRARLADAVAREADRPPA